MPSVYEMITIIAHDILRLLSMVTIASPVWARPVSPRQAPPPTAAAAARATRVNSSEWTPIAWTSHILVRESVGCGVCEGVYWKGIVCVSGRCVVWV